MADYPTTIYAPRTKQNKNGVVYDAAKSNVIFAEDISKLDTEIVAIETELERPILTEHADNAAAKTAGLADGQLYRTADVLKIVHS